MGNLFTSKSSNANGNNGIVTQGLSGTLANGGAANNQLAALLGIGGDPAAAQAGYQNYQNSTGFQNQLDSMSRGITGNQAASGLLRSGSTGTALQTGANDLAKGNFNNYLSQLLGLSNAGQGAASTIVGVGTQVSKSTPSAGSMIGGALSLFSDRRLKRDIEHIGDMEDGLPVYEYRYVGEHERHTGVMADEVEKLRPWALGPEVGGYKTVNYEVL